MDAKTDSPESKVPGSWPGVVKNLHGGYHIHVIANKRETPVIGSAMNSQALAPPGSPVLARISVFEDCPPCPARWACRCGACERPSGERVDRYCRHDGALSEGTVITVLVINSP